jgi:hypothetical protein
MNRKLLLFSGLITMVLGAGLGWILSDMFPARYRSTLYPDQTLSYVLIGGTGGFLFGVSMEALRELKEQRDLEEKDRELEKTEERIIKGD